jgi:hypothetical protein
MAVSSIGKIGKSRKGPSQASRLGGDQQTFCFWSKSIWWKRKCEAVQCHDAIASSFVAKVQGKVFSYFHAITVKCHSSMQNWVFALPGQILCEQSPWFQRQLLACSFLFTCLAFFGLSEFRFPNQTPMHGSCLHACLIIVSISNALFPRVAQNLMYTCYRSHHEIASSRILNPK